MAITLTPTRTNGDDTMEIPMTIPLTTDDGREFSEVSVVVDVFVTHPAMPQTWNSPAEGPEWEVDTIMLDLGRWETIPKTKWIADSVKMPDWLNVPVNAYIESKKGHEEIGTAIQESRYG